MNASDLPDAVEVVTIVLRPAAACFQSSAWWFQSPSIPRRASASTTAGASSGNGEVRPARDGTAVR
ncbi:MAG: hypothetical protein U0R50_05965 [Gaiellales bacterium]